MFEQSRVPGALLTTFLVLGSYYIWKRQHARQGYPPGPFTLPILGNLLQVILSGDFVKFMNRYRSVYGRVFTVELGGARRVVVSDYDVISHLLVNKAGITSNRSVDSLSPEWKQMQIENGAIMFSPYPIWEKLRKFTLQHLKEGGMGRTQMEPHIREEIHAFCDKCIERTLGHPITLQENLMKGIANVISTMVFGGRRDYDDPKLEEQVKAAKETLQLEMKAGVTATLPFSSLLGIHKKMSEQTWILRHEFEAEVNAHKNKLDKDNCSDIYDHFLVKQKEELNSNGKLECFTDGNAQMLAFQLFVAGADTTSLSITWAILYTCAHPDVMCKVKQEIMNVIGLDRPPSYSDRSNMPYTDAVLHETLRLSNIAPGALPHTLSEAHIIDDKNVPAGTNLLLNMSSILHDGKVFEDPLEFNPDRYLNGDVKMKKERTIPFSIGRRACLGEALARTVLFLFYVTLMQRYDIRFPDDQPNPSLNADIGVVCIPKPFKVIFTQKAL